MWKTIINPAPWPLLASKKTYNLQTFFIQAYSHLCFLFTTFINCCWNPVIRGRFWVLWFVLNQFFTFFKTFFPVSDRQMPTNWFLNIKEQSVRGGDNRRACADHVNPRTRCFWWSPLILERNLLKWYYDYFSTPWFLIVSYRILWKNKNVVYRFQIFELVPEIIKFEKGVKHANEWLMTSYI